MGDLPRVLAMYLSFTAITFASFACRRGSLGFRRLKRPSLKGVDMRIVVDLNRCQGYAQCVPLAPTVLKLNGEEALMYNPNPDDSLRQQVMRAAASCPVQAILVERLDDQEEKS